MLDSLPVARDLDAEVRDLLIDLNVSLEKTRLAKAQRKTYLVKTSKGEEEVDSWKFNEYGYFNNDVTLPIRARGLFTMDGKVVARGYDKFFNVDEVAATKKEKLSKLTGPFEVSTKENGCIVFISGLKDGTLLVCSKHVTGEPIGDIPQKAMIMKHSSQAQAAVFEQLEKAGKKPAELAKVLYDHNATAVAELCDDKFEEHIVQYPEELAGLYLHGVNSNTRAFNTYPMEDVFELADAFGFKRVHVNHFDTFEKLWDVLEECSVLGRFQGRETEGFVVRAKNSEGKPSFFKYKFEKPYYLYRTMRESTKMLIEKHKNLVSLVLAEETYPSILYSYLRFVMEEFAEKPHLAEDFLKDKGIVDLRKRFFRSRSYFQDGGVDIDKLEGSKDLDIARVELFDEIQYKYILVPIAVVGSGKTTVFKTLNNIFPLWAHIQNDDFQLAKGFRECFVRSLENLPVLLLDRNNTMRRERREITVELGKLMTKNVLPNVCPIFIGVNFGAAYADPAFEKLVRQRVQERGDTHQCIKASSNEARTTRIITDMLRKLEQPRVAVKKEDETEKEVHVENSGEEKEEQQATEDGKVPEEKSLDTVSFINKSELADPDNNFEFIMNVDIVKSNSLDIAKQIWHALQRYEDFKLVSSPSESEWQTAYDDALKYKPTFQKKIADNRNKKRPEYYGISVKDRDALVALLEQKLSSNSTWTAIAKSRVQGEFHVTIGHKDTVHAHDMKSAWEDLGRRFGTVQVRKNTGDDKFVLLDDYFDIRLVRAVVFENRLVTIEVKLEQGYKTDENGNVVKDKTQVKPLNEHLHITIGTSSESIRPMELNPALKELFLTYGNELEDKVYKLKESTAQVVNLDQVLEKQRAFIMFSFDF